VRDLTLLTRLSNVPTFVSVECWKAYKVHCLMNSSFYAALYILSHDDVLVDVILLKHLHGRAWVGDVPGQISTLYPTRELEAVNGETYYYFVHIYIHISFDYLCFYFE